MKHWKKYQILTNLLQSVGLLLISQQELFIKIKTAAYIIIIDIHLKK